MAITLPVNPAQSNAEVGKDFLLYISIVPSGDTAPVWQLVGGQRSSNLSRSAEEIDVSNKTSGGWNSVKAGQRSWSIDLDSLVVSDDLGYQAMNQAYLSGKEINVLLRNSTDTFAVKGWGSITDFSLDTPHDDAASISGTISGNGALEDATGETV